MADFTAKEITELKKIASKQDLEKQIEVLSNDAETVLKTKYTEITIIHETLNADVKVIQDQIKAL